MSLGYQQVTQRQQIHQEWIQQALENAHVVVLSPGPSETAGWFLCSIAALGVSADLLSRDGDWAAEVAVAAAEVNPFVQVRSIPVRGRSAPLVAGLAVSFETAGERLEMLGAREPFLTVSLGESVAVCRGGRSESPVSPDEISTGAGAPVALSEALVQVVAATGAFSRLVPRELLSAATLAPAARPFGLFVLGCGALANALLVALRISGIRPTALWLVDHDRIDASNLNRQVLFRFADQGSLKAEVMAERARELFPDCAVTSIPERFRPEHLDRFVRTVRPVAPVAALLSDNWSSRVAAMDTARDCGVDALLYGGTSFETAKVRLFGLGVEGSWCLGCGAEQARDRADEEEALSCSSAPDASMVLPNLAAGAEAASLLTGWLGGARIALGGKEISLVSPTRVVEGPVLAPCECLVPRVRVGTLTAAEKDIPVFLNDSVPFDADESVIRVVGVRTPTGAPEALLLLPPGVETMIAVGSDPDAGALLLRSGERCLVGGTAVVFRGEAFSDRPGKVTTGCSFCLTPIEAGEVAERCPEGHVLCGGCAAEGGCLSCGGSPAEGAA